MKRPHQVFLVVAAMFLLAGCVLKSPAPAFGDSQGALALAEMGKSFNLESFTSGAWKVEEKAIFTPEGNHYVMSSPEGKTPVEVLMVPIDGKRFVVQAREDKNKPFTYLIAVMGKDEVLVNLIGCDDLKKMGTVSEDISFDGGNCGFAKTPDLALFAKIADAAGPAKARLTPAP